MGESSRVRWTLAVAVTLSLGACASTGVSVGRSAGVSATGMSSVQAASCGMFPLFGPGDHLQLDSDVGELRRGDIVSYRVTPAGMQPQQMVHRVVGLPGERLDPAPDGGILVNGSPLVEDYLPAGMTTYLREPIDVPPDQWFVMGDNRGRSSDSRVAGPIPRADILGKLTKVVPVPGDEEDVCGVVPADLPGPPLTINDDDPPALQLVILPAMLQQTANQKVTADNLEAARSELRTHTDRLEAVLQEVGDAGHEAAHGVLRDEMIPALRSMIAAGSVDEWIAHRQPLPAAMNRYLQAVQADVLGD